MSDRSAAQHYALLVGAPLVLGGIVGFFYSDAFGTPGMTKDVLGVLSVNGWHNVFHLVTGALGLLCAPHRPRARAYALGLGAVYLALSIWGFALGSGSTLLSIIPVNTEDNVLHLVLGLLGIAAALAAHERTPTARALTP